MVNIYCPLDIRRCILLLRILQQGPSILGGRVLLGVAQPSQNIIFHPVCAMTMTQDEVVLFLTLQQQIRAWMKKRKCGFETVCKHDPISCVSKGLWRNCAAYVDGMCVR